MPVIHRLYAIIFRFTRKRRMKRFESALRPADWDKIIDIGGTSEIWRYTLSRPSILLVNLTLPADCHVSDGRWEAEVGDGCCLRYPDNAFDIAFSNSVIEHVGDYERQRKFAEEIRRVGRRVWVQTPARCFPVEPHYLTLFIHWLPKRWQKSLLPFGSVHGWLDILSSKTRETICGMVDEIRLLSKAEMEELFPDCQILTERVLFWPKAYVAIRGQVPLHPEQQNAATSRTLSA